METVTVDVPAGINRWHRKLFNNDRRKLTDGHVCAENVEQDVDVPIIDDLLTRLPLEIEDARGDLFSILSLKRPHLELLLGEFVLNDAPLAYQARVEVVDLFVLI